MKSMGIVLVAAACLAAAPVYADTGYCVAFDDDTALVTPTFETRAKSSHQANSLEKAKVAYHAWLGANYSKPIPAHQVSCRNSEDAARMQTARSEFLTGRVSTYPRSKAID